MGLFGGGNKKTVATQLTAGAQTQAGDPVSVSISGKANTAYVSNTATDYGAIGASFDFAEGFGSEVLGFGRAVIDRVLDGNEAVFSQLKSSNDKAVDQITNYAESSASASKAAISQVADFAKSQSLNNDERITKIALWGVGIVAAVAVGPQLVSAFKG